MKKLIAWALLQSVCQTAGAQLVINELMQSNVDCVMDDRNEFPDSWVELYNSGTQAVNLRDYRLGLTDRAGEAWQLPSRTVAPGAHVLVYCDKEATGLHTDFRLESGKGGGVWLFQGAVADKVTDLAEQPAPNIAYGRTTDGSNGWGYQAVPTPGQANCGSVCERVLGSPVFSEPGQVVRQGASLTVALSLPKGAPAGTEIRLTYDGSEPTRSSWLYTEPIPLASTRVIRARLFCDGWLSPPSVAQSYLFFPREVTLPVVSIMTNNKYLNDPKIGIYVDGSYQQGKKNYEFNWRRPVNIEFFEGEQRASAINQLCEARVAGGATRGAMLKTLAVYAHKRFGKKRIDYELFPDQKSGLRKFKSILLRNAGNDFDYLYMRDAIIQRTMAAHTDLDWQAWRPAIVFINGTYKGILNIRERSNEDNIWSNYDGLEDIDMIENWWDVKAGDLENFNRFQAFINEHGHTLEEYGQWMDWSEFADLMLMNLYYNNLDTPGNNFMMWRPRTEGGRWRFVVKDTDFSLGLYGVSADYRIFNWLYNPTYDGAHNWGANSRDATRLFRRLMDDKDFFRIFIDRACIYPGDFLNEKGTRELWDSMYEQIRAEYPHHRRLINQWWPNYADEVASARRWLSARTDQFYRQLGDYYRLGTAVRMGVNTSTSRAGELEVAFNGIRLSRGVFDGKFFAGREVTLEGRTADGREVDGWSVTTVANDGRRTDTRVTGGRYSFLMPDCRSLTVNAVIEPASGITTAGEAGWTWHRDADRLFLTGVPAGTRVQLYDLRGVLLHATVSDGSAIVVPLAAGRLHILKVGAKAVKL